MIIRVSDIPDEGLQIEGADAIEQPFADASWALDDLSLRVEKRATPSSSAVGWPPGSLRAVADASSPSW